MTRQVSDARDHKKIDTNPVSGRWFTVGRLLGWFGCRIFTACGWVMMKKWFKWFMGLLDYGDTWHASQYRWIASQKCVTGREADRTKGMWAIELTWYRSEGLKNRLIIMIIGEFYDYRWILPLLTCSDTDNRLRFRWISIQNLKF
jgi:hypothetical protein